MAIAKVVYKENSSATPEVWMDTTQKTVTAGTMLSGTTALKNDGTGITGNIASKSSSDLTASGATVTAPAGYYASSASKSVTSGTATTPATSITANPTISVDSAGLITASVSGSKSVTPTVSAGYVSSGTAGTVSVSGSNTEQLSTQAGTTITPTESVQTAVASGKYTTGAVKVGAISSTYVGSGITQRDSTDLTASGATVTAPAGYYAEAASKSVASGSAGTPTATKGTVSSHSVSVTPSVTNTTGYITGGTLTGTAVTVSASELVSGTKSITASGTIDVTNYASASVAAGTAGTPTATKGTVSNHSISVTPSVTNTTGYITGSTISGTSVTVDVTELESGTKSITENGTGISVSGYSTVDVAVPGQVPTGVKYIYTDVDGVNAYNVSGFEKVSVDYAGLLDDKFRLWVETTEANTTFSFVLKTSGLVSCHAIWGDGGEEDFNSAGQTPATVVGVGYSKTVSHIYTTAGRYCAVISSTGNLIAGLECKNNSYLKGVEIASYISQWYASNYFSGCPNLESITFSASNADTTTTPNSACCQNLSSLKRVVFNSSASSIPSFANDVSLEELTLPATVGVLAFDTFNGCSMLRRVNGLSSASITSMPQYMFSNCSSLLSVTIPQSVTTFQSSVFIGSAIKSITIPQSVTDLGRSTFQNCTYLKEVHLLPTTPPTIYASSGAYANPFKNTHPDLVLYVPQGYLSAYQSATNWASFSSIMQEE